MPLPFPGLEHISDDDLFPCLNFVMVGYIALIFFPGWRYTKTVTFSCVVMYSALYFALLGKIAKDALPPPPIVRLPPGSGFSSLDEVVALFSHRGVMFAGWTHYIAFDLFMARHIVLESREVGIPHWSIAPLVVVTLFAGPAGVCLYVMTKAAWDFFVPGREARALWTARRGVLVLLYVATTGLSAMMVGWILVFPGSWMGGRWKLHDDWIEESFDKYAAVFPTPKSLITKYQHHPSVQLTHILPAACWALLVPIQIHPDVRRRYRRAHRWLGKLFVALSLAVFAGLLIIDARGLVFILSDFPTIEPHAHMSKIGLQWLDHMAVFRGIGLYFLLSILLAVQRARAKDFAGHQRWIFRHIGSGLWVAVQRIYVGVMMTEANTPEDQKANFADGATLGAALTIVTAEVAIQLVAWGKASPSSKKTS